MPSNIYFRKMVGNRWKTLEVSPEEIESVIKHYFIDNLMLMERCFLNTEIFLNKSEKLQGKNITPGMKEKMALLLMEKMITPLHFAIENYVEEGISKDNSDL
jgi:hypothetical protein